MKFKIGVLTKHCWCVQYCTEKIIL